MQHTSHTQVIFADSAEEAREKYLALGIKPDNDPNAQLDVVKCTDDEDFDIESPFNLIGEISVGIDVMNIIRVQKEEVKQSLDSAVTEEAVAYYDALKQGNRYSDYVEASFLSDRAYRALGFGLPQTEIRTVYRDGMEVSVMERPEITVSMEGGFGVQVSYRLIVPFLVFGKHIKEISVPVDTGSFYQLK